MPAKNPVTYSDPAVTPFSFTFDVSDHLLVVQAADESVSSYSVMPNGMLKVVSQNVSSGDVSPCWIVGNGIGPIFTTNPGGLGTIASYKDWVPTGKLTLLNGLASEGYASVDEGISHDGQFLYALAPGNGVDGFKIASNGNLTSLGASFAYPGITLYAQGIAVW
jgi:6-phosphogluconolactonase (cycloisomerase 2 family)